MTPVALTAITDLILAAETLFFAGMLAGVRKQRFSAGWWWAGMLLLLGVAALLGGIDHGFFDPLRLPRYFIQRGDWIVLGGTTFCVLMATSRQFLPLRVQRIVLAIGIVQLAVNVVVDLLIDSFLDVALNYLPVMILLLVVNALNVNRAGRWEVTAGILILFTATGFQVAGVDALSPLDHNGLYHLVSMVAVVFLYLGGRRLKG